MHLVFRLALSAAVAAPVVVVGGTSAALAKEPSALDVREFERLFGNFKRDIERQVEKGEIYPATVERARKDIGKVIGYIRKSGADAAPFEAQLEDFIADAQRRAGASKQSSQRANISTDVPKVAAMAGIESIGPQAPTWCAAYERELGGSVSSARELELPRTASQVTLEKLQEAGWFSCGVRDHAPVQAWTAAYRQTVSNLLGLTAAENEALMVSAAARFTQPKRLTYAEETALKNNPPATVCGSFPSLASGLLEERVSRNLERHVLQCGSTPRSVDFELKALELTFEDGRYPFRLVDVGDGPTTELAKLGLVYRLLTSHEVQEHDLYAPQEASNPSRVIENYALARTVERDPARLAAELEALPLDDALRWELRLRVAGAERAMAIVGAFAEAIAERDPAIQAVFFDGPERGVAAYQQQVAKSAGVLELVLAIEDRFTGEPGGMDGCGERFYQELTPWLQERLRADPSIDGPDALHFDDLRGSLLLYGLIRCGRDDATVPALTEVLRDGWYDRTSMQRGPLSAAYQGMLAAYGEARANPAPASFSTGRGASSSRVELGQIFWNPVAPPAFGNNVRTHTVERERQGVIATLAPSGAGRVRLTFAQDSYQSPIRHCVETNRIDRIDEQGRVLYRKNCRTTGYETVTFVHDPVEMPSWAAAGLAPGQLLVYRATRPSGGESYAWPLASYRDKSAKKLVSLLGVAAP